MLKTSRLIKEINIFLYQIFFISLFSRLRKREKKTRNVTQFFGESILILSE